MVNLTEFKAKYNYDYVLEINKLSALEKVVQISTGRCKGSILFHHVHKFRVSKQISDKYSMFEPTNLSNFVLSSSLLNKFSLHLFSYGSLSSIGKLSDSYSKTKYELGASRFSDHVDFFSERDKTFFNLFSFMTSPDSSYFLLGNNEKVNRRNKVSSIDKMFPYEKTTQEIMKKYLK